MTDTETLWREYRLSRDYYFRDRLFEHYLPIASRKARRMRVWGKARRILDDDDMESVANGALLRAIETVDQRGVPFLAYARMLMGYAIVDEMRRVLGQSMQPIRLSELNEPGIRENPAHALERSESIEKILNLYCRSDREREVLELYFLRGHTLCQVGNHFGISESRVCAIIRRVLRGRQVRRKPGGRVKLSNTRYAEIRERYSRGDISQTTLARRYGISQPMVSKIIATGRKFALLVILALTVTPVLADRLEPSDLDYQGAFLLPAGTHGGSRWGYGALALTFNPEGDDGRGSLFGAGHVYQDFVGECSIPEQPMKPAGKDISGLPAARQIQAFADVTGSFRAKLAAANLDTLGGLTILDGRLYWSFYRYYAVQPLAELDVPTHGRSTLDLANPQPEGLWHVGPYGNPLFSQKRTANYMCAIPKDWAEKYAGGRRLATGKGDGPGSAGNSHGPALYAVRTPPAGTPDSTALDAIVLLHYPPSGSDFPGWSPCDEWEGLVWLEHAVFFAGRRGRGETCYGSGEECGDPCDATKGYHCQPYEPEIAFYDPAELAEVAAGVREPETVLPYATLQPEFIDTCHFRLGGMAADEALGRIYLVQVNGERPLVHVWSVKAKPAAAKVTVSLDGKTTEFSAEGRAKAIAQAINHLVAELLGEN